MSIICLLMSVLSMTGPVLPIDSVINRIDIQKWMYPQEKIYLTTNDDQFISGDTVRINLELLDALTLVPSEFSKYVYVELLTPFDEVVRRVKLIRRDDCFKGYMPLPSDLPEGEYELVAYTRYMENLGSNFFAVKRLHIISPERGKKYLTYFCDSQGDNLKITANSFSSDTDEALPSVITIKTKSGKVYSSVRKKTSFSCSVKKEDWNAGIVLLEADNYRTYKPLPYNPESLNVKLFPEGGHLVNSSINTVGIKITDACGRGVKQDVKIVDKNKNTVISAVTDKRGLGQFKIFADREEEYSLATETDTVPIILEVNDNPGISVNTMKDETVLVQPIGSIAENTTLLIHSRGNLLYYDFVDGNRPLSFDAKQLPSGIYEFILFSGAMHPLAVRQAFVASDNLDGKTVVLNLVGEAGEYIPDYENLCEIKNRKVRYEIDNIMLTSERWQRYDIPEVIVGKYSEPMLPLEIGAVLSGVAKSRWKRKALAGVRVDVIAPSIDYFASVVTDNEGRFVIDGVDWPDGTRFAVKVINKDGEPEDNFELDEETYPTVHNVPSYYEGNKPVDNLSSDIVNRLSHWLDEVIVEGRHSRNSDDENTLVFDMIGAKAITPEMLESKGITTYEEAIRLFAGVRISGGKVIYSGASGSIFGGDNSVEFYVDGTKWSSAIQNALDGGESRFASNAMAAAAERTAISMTGGLVPKDMALQQHASNSSDLAEFASTFPFHNIERIYFLRPSAAIFLSGKAARSGGALVFITKSGAGKKTLDDNLQIKVFAPLGYQSDLSF